MITMIETDSRGELRKRVDAFERELIKRKFWALGMRNTINEMKKEIESFLGSSYYSSKKRFIRGISDPEGLVLTIEKWLGKKVEKDQKIYIGQFTTIFDRILDVQLVIQKSGDKVFKIRGGRGVHRNIPETNVAQVWSVVVKREKDWFTITDIIASLRIPRQVVYYCLVVLVAKGLLKSSFDGKSTTIFKLI